MTPGIPSSGLPSIAGNSSTPAGHPQEQKPPRWHSELLWDTTAPLGPGLVPTLQPWLSFLLLQPKAEHPRDLQEGEGDKETNATQ